VALRRLQSLSKESLAINSLSCSVILLFLGDSFVVLKPVDVLVYFYHQVGGNKENECEKKKVHKSIIKKPHRSESVGLMVNAKRVSPPLLNSLRPTLLLPLFSLHASARGV
jgi:hypothetical protein